MIRIKIILLTLVLIFPTIVTFSQTDSTTIYYKGIENRELRTICELSDIQIEKIYCEDTLIRGKVFNLIIKEFKKGKVHSEKNLNLTSETQEYEMIVGGDTLIYQLDFVDKAGFGRSEDSFTLAFAGILKNDKFKLKMEYPGMGINQVLNGNGDYSLRAVNSCSNNKVRVPIHSAYPILAYTPPVDAGAELNSYCVLGDENVLDWYNKFKVKHYYVIYLEIK